MYCSCLFYRLIIYSATGISTLSEETACSNDCYQPCGNILNPEDLTNVGDNVVLRFFHFSLSDLHKYVGNNPLRVYVYAQTVVIDESVDVEFALLIRARQVSVVELMMFLCNVSSSLLQPVLPAGSCVIMCYHVLSCL